MRKPKQKRFNIYGSEINGIAQYIGFIYSDSEQEARKLIGNNSYTLIEQRNALIK